VPATAISDLLERGGAEHASLADATKNALLTVRHRGWA
jgi:hypothetical protein